MPLSSVASLATRKTWRNPIFFSFPASVLIWMTSQILQRHIPWHLDWEYPLVFIKADISEIYFSFVFFFSRNKRKNKRYIIIFPIRQPFWKRMYFLIFFHFLLELTAVLFASTVWTPTLLVETKGKNRCISDRKKYTFGNPQMIRRKMKA